MNSFIDIKAALLIFMLFIFRIGAMAKGSKVESYNYLSIRGSLPTSLLEFESIYSFSLQLKHKNIGIELEHGQILGFNRYLQSSPSFKTKTNGGRTRVNLKYYFYNLPDDNLVRFHFYTSIMPSFKSVKYRMKWWSYDSLGNNNSTYQTDSHIPVTFTTKSLSLNLLFGNEFYFSFLNVDYYGGVGIKFFDINIPSSAPSYFEPISRQSSDGTYFNVLIGAKVGFVYRYRRTMGK